MRPWFSASQTLKWRDPVISEVRARGGEEPHVLPSTPASACEGNVTPCSAQFAHRLPSRGSGTLDAHGLPSHPTALPAVSQRF